MKFNSSNKIIGVEVLKLEIKNLGPNKTIGLCHGVFDVLHSGHIRYFEEASNLVDVLVVSVTSDDFVSKGPGRPVNTIKERMNILASINLIDYIIESNSFTAVEIIESLKPNYYFKGKDYSPNLDSSSADLAGNLGLETAATINSGGEVYYTSSPLYSSSSLINSLTFSKQYDRSIIDYVKLFFKLNPIENYLKLLKDKKVSIIGEIISDEYIYTESLGKSGKHPIVAEREIYRKQILGGIIPIVSTFETFIRSGNVNVISLANSDSLRYRSPSYANIVTDKNYTPIVKTRYINEKTNTFMYEIYQLDDKFISENSDKAILSSLQKSAEDSDLLISLDFGHGLITPSSREFIGKYFKYLALNVQKNAGNKGFSTISKYNFAHLVVLNGEEVELELKQKGTDLSEAAILIHKKMQAQIVVITDGSNGLVISDGLSTYRIPACFSGVIKDRTGAGDSVFAIISLFSLVIKDLKVLGYLGNLAGALNLNWIANENIITSDHFLKALIYSLK